MKRLYLASPTKRERGERNRKGRRTEKRRRIERRKTEAVCSVKPHDPHK